MSDNAFQSTPPVKAATKFNELLDYSRLISIHAAREGGDFRNALRRLRHHKFQSTPPVKAATVVSIFASKIYYRFQSTPPVKAATWLYAWNQYDYVISIHAAREGGDFKGYNKHIK